MWKEILTDLVCVLCIAVITWGFLVIGHGMGL